MNLKKTRQLGNIPMLRKTIITIMLVITPVYIIAQKDKEAAKPEIVGLQIGDEAPKFALRTLDGKYELLTRWTGERLSRPASQPVRHVVLVSFFATWCQPCMKELPHLENLWQKYQEREVRIFLVDITDATRSVPQYADAPEPAPFLKERGLTMPLLLDTYGMAMERYVPDKMLPRLFVLDKYRTIKLIKRGFHEGEDFEGELSAIIDELLKDPGEKKSD
ncbi:MAG TPA: TlpA family protein disulfide reductase [Candidatus Marinimicrobia bacterium]|nr:TlpA family protein disulfide reductase [Candidatus Neomarinimicrobiota bacterium]HIB02853.1 TlpA family protein disulfide reductase [Candidatus Neomarinimicrobiota bacterium]